MICENMDESFRHYAGHDKPDTRVHTVWFYLYETLEQAQVINGGETNKQTQKVVA